LVVQHCSFGRAAVGRDDGPQPDLEEIQSTMLSDEQRPAAIFPLEPVKEVVASALEPSDAEQGAA
jgi:hypothetical protein